MTSIDPPDRQLISSLHAMSSGTGQPVNHRDASGSTTAVWKKKPTLIATPKNPSDSFRSHARENNTTGARSFNPYSNRTHTNLVQSHKSQAGNPAARQTLTAPSAKRQKTTHGRTEARGRNPPHLNGKGKAPLLAPDPEDVINVDENDEDLGMRVPASSDDLNIRDPYLTTTNSAIPTRSKLELDVKMTQPHPFESGNNDIVDGPSTIRLQKKHKQNKQLSSDPIESFDPPVSSKHPPTRGIVKEKIAVLEKLRKPDPPHLDLRAMQSTKSMKNSMKPKITQKFGQRDHAVTSKTNFINGSTKTTDQAFAERLASKTELPLQAWCLGRKLFQDKDDGIYYLSWDEKSSNLAMKLGSAGKRSFRTTEISVDNNVKSIEYSRGSSDKSNPIVRLEMFPPIKNSRAKYGVYEEYLKPGFGPQGCITLKFRSNHPDYSQEKYEELVCWLTKFKKPDFVTPAGATSIWEAAMRCAGSEVVTKRSLKRQASEDLPKIREGTGTPPPSIFPVTARPKSRRQSENGHPPLEPPSLGSKGRPQPIPAFKLNENGEPDPPESLRRSLRHPGPQSRRPSPSCDPDELILVYPPATTGAVNLTNADLGRLKPGEFLNDTLIEFGLKLWLKELEEKDPELVKQIHVFSSFFYKKLNKKNLEEGYQSVRKWTSKFDLFSKKYIIVPINEHLHWYLAIIYQPEHILSPPLDTVVPVSTRRRARASNADEPSSSSITAVNDSAPQEIPAATDDHMTDLNQLTPSEAQVEETLFDFKQSCSITASHNGQSKSSASPSSIKDLEVMLVDSNPHETSNERSSSPLTMCSEDEDLMDVEPGEAQSKVSREVSLTVSDIVASNLASRRSSPERETALPNGDASSIPIINVESLSDNQPLDDAMNVTGKEDAISVDLTTSAVTSADFYGSTSKGKGKQRAVVETPAMDVDADHGEEMEILSLQPTTHIYTLDSLGSRHPQATKILRQYLKMEAKDKKGYQVTREAQGRQALVPVQPNYCDCGIYLLHFAQTFMKDPVKYSQTIQKQRSPNMAQRQADWDDASIGGYRERLASRIGELSVEWKKERAVKEELRKEGKGTNDVEVIESSDDDIDIVEDVWIAPTPAKGRGKADVGSGRVSGKAARMRG